MSDSSNAFANCSSWNLAYVYVLQIRHIHSYKALHMCKPGVNAVVRGSCLVRLLLHVCLVRNVCLTFEKMLHAKNIHGMFVFCFCMYFCMYTKRGIHSEQPCLYMYIGLYSVKKGLD